MSDLEDAAVGPAARDLARSFSRARRQPTPPAAPRTARRAAFLALTHAMATGKAMDAKEVARLLDAIEAEAADPAASGLDERLLEQAIDFADEAVNKDPSSVKQWVGTISAEYARLLASAPSEGDE